MARRAVLFDRDNVEIAHVAYREMDDYIRRGLVERLTPIRSNTHRFRLLLESVAEALPRISQCSLTAPLSRENAGVSESLQAVFWARRKVRAWPQVGKPKAGDNCPLIVRKRAR